MSLVLDCSVAIAWLFEDEATRETEALAEQVAAAGAIVPSLWRLEIANVLLQAEKRVRLPAGGAGVRLEVLSDLPIVVDPQTDVRAWRETLTLARAHGLTVYDAAYLELALRKGLPLATRDAALIAAARVASVALA